MSRRRLVLYLRDVAVVLALLIPALTLLTAAMWGFSALLHLIP